MRNMYGKSANAHTQITAITVFGQFKKQTTVISPQ